MKSKDLNGAPLLLLKHLSSLAYQNIVLSPMFPHLKCFVPQMQGYWDEAGHGGTHCRPSPWEAEPKDHPESEPSLSSIGRPGFKKKKITEIIK